MSDIFDLESKKNKSEERPQFLLEVITNIDGDIEEYTLIDCYEVGNENNNLKYYIADYIDERELKAICTEPDAQYHVYGRVDCYRSGYYEVEYDTEFTVTDCILLVKGFENFCKETIDFEEQEHLKNNDTEIDHTTVNDDDGWGEITNFHLTYNDLVRITKEYIKKDIYFAHRIVSEKYAKDILGEEFSKDILKIEKKRREFKDFLRYNRDKNLKVRFDTNGYIITKRYEKNDKEILITFDQIDSIKDDILVNCTSEELFDIFYTGPKMMQILDDANKNAI